MDICVFGYPRQGTDWFMKCAGYEKDNNGKNGYYREYFNLIVNRRYTNLFKNIMGTEINSKYIFYESNEFEINNLIEKTWKKDKLKITKENFCYTKIPLMIKHFDCFILYRHRKHTFPTSREDYIKGIYESFLKNDYKINSFNRIKSFCKNCNFNHTFELSHIISYTFTFYYANIYNIPVILYHDLVTNTQEEILQNIQAIKWNFRLSKELFVKNVLQTRMSVEQLEKREERYYSLNAEEECKILITFIKNLNILDPKYLEYLN